MGYVPSSLLVLVLVIYFGAAKLPFHIAKARDCQLLYLGSQCRCTSSALVVMLFGLHQFHLSPHHWYRSNGIEKLRHHCHLVCTIEKSVNEKNFIILGCKLQYTKGTNSMLNLFSSRL